jgi:glutathione peroxidase
LNQLSPGSVFDFSAPLLNQESAGQPFPLARFQGRVLLIVNTASRCGFTPQYGGLEDLYRRYKDRGFEVLAFPSNQFGAQEPGPDAEIGAFCQRNYGVDFPVFGKIDVNGADAHPLYQFLKKRRPGFLGMEKIRWNFTKFLCDRKGEPVRRYASWTAPKEIAPAIEGLL